MTEHTAVSMRLIAGGPNPNPRLKGWFYLKKGRKWFSTAY